MTTNRGNLDQTRRDQSTPDNFSDIIDIQEETQAGAENLRQSTIDSSISNVGTRSDLMVQQRGLEYNRDIHSLVGFLSVIDKLLDEIEDTKKGISKKGLSKAGKKTMNEAKAKLNQYEKQLKAKRKALLKQPKSEIYDNDINAIKNIWQQVDQVRRDIGMGQWGEYANNASYLYNSPENARKSNKRQANNLEFNQKFQEELKTGAISTIFNGNAQKTNDFFRRIAQGEYTAADYQLYVRNAAVLNPCFQRYGIAIPTNPRGMIGGERYGGVERVSGTTRRSVDYSNMDFGEAFQQGGIAGVIDKGLSYCKNMTPGQRNAWKSIAVLGGFAAGIYGLYKFYTSKKSFITKAGITAAVIFGTQALTGEGPISLFNKLMTGGLTKEYLESKFGNLFGDAVDGVQSSGIESGSELSGAMYSMMVFNENAKVGDVRKRSKKFKNNPQEWNQFRLDAINKLRKYGNNRAERFSAIFSEKFDENKWNERLNSIGIHDGIDDNKLVYELASNKSINAMIINKFLSDNGVKVTDNKTKREEYEQYKKSMNDSNQAIDIAVLEEHKNDWFKTDLEATYTDRGKDRENIKALENQVEELSIDPQKKAELKIAIKRFYDERTIASKPELSDFSLEMDNGFLILTSHKGRKTKINLNENEIDGFGKGVTFTDLSDLLNTADISNKILETQKGKIPKDMPPFEYKIFGKKGRGIYFNNADFSLSSFLSLDTRVLSGGRGGKMGEIEALSKHPEDYATYLSNRWLKENEINIDSTLYPNVKRLSNTGITFINEQEVKNLEVWLKGIKENLKFAVSTPDGNPFSITFTNKLEFKAVNGDTKDFPENISEKFPTLLRTGNKEKFLKMMNNTSNKMRGAVHK